MKNLIIIIFLCTSTAVWSQFYTREFGVRGGYTSAFVFRVNIHDALSYEAQVAYRDGGSIAGLVRQVHREIGMDQNGNWIFTHGFGAHLGFYLTNSYRFFFREIYYGRRLFTPVVGLDGYMAIEYQMVDVPVSFGVNFQPYMEISLKKLFGINLWDFGVSVKYRF
ncbi:MAG: hypothetical protein EHM46_02675 [Bacteroidetes bacterium]|nr:MAG: hypothetical protein EHM46_02675 [Bacteroidota bacterium]